MSLVQQNITTQDSLIFEKTRESVIALKKMVQFLTPAQKETLETLMDPQTMNQLEESLTDERAGRV